MSNSATTPLRDNRTYYVSDERLRAFAQLSYAQRLQWVEQCSQFVRLAQMAKAKLAADRVDRVQGANPVFNLAVGLKDCLGE